VIKIVYLFVSVVFPRISGPLHLMLGGNWIRAALPVPSRFD
jgi:hypothetical protein